MIAFLIGTILGAIYFGGLYFTTENINKVEHPALLMTMSFILRMGLLVLTFLYLSRRGYKDMILALVAIIIVRIIITFAIKKDTFKSTE